MYIYITYIKCILVMLGNIYIYIPGSPTYVNNIVHICHTYVACYADFR